MRRSKAYKLNKMYRIIFGVTTMHRWSRYETYYRDVLSRPNSILRSYDNLYFTDILLKIYKV